MRSLGKRDRPGVSIRFSRVYSIPPQGKHRCKTATGKPSNIEARTNVTPNREVGTTPHGKKLFGKNETKRNREFREEQLLRPSQPPTPKPDIRLCPLPGCEPPPTHFNREELRSGNHTPGMANPDGDVAMKTALSNSAMSGRRTRPTHDAIPQGPGLVTTMNPRPCRPEPDSAKKQSSRCEAWVPVGSPLLKFSPTSAGNEQTREQLTKYGRGGRPTYLAVVAW